MLSGFIPETAPFGERSDGILLLYGTLRYKDASLCSA